jgi:ATP/maltotriose-dependent transcriptional regulator MalT
MDLRYGEVYTLGVRVQAARAERARLKRSDREVTEAIEAAQPFNAALSEWRAAYFDSQALRPAVEAWLAVCAAETSRLRGEVDPAAWTTAADRFEQLGLPYVTAYCRWREAEAVLASGGDRLRAVNVLSAAFETASRLGAKPLLSEVESLGQRARIALERAQAQDASPAAKQSDGFGLTDRERDVLTLIAAGRTNRQIGTELFISVKTAGIHVSNILGKLGVASRGEAGALAHKLGLDQRDEAVRR